jgi:hypothetical protein
MGRFGMEWEPKLAPRKTVPWTTFAPPAPNADDLNISLEDEVEVYGSDRIVARGRLRECAAPNAADEAFHQQCRILTFLARIASILLREAAAGSGGEALLCRSTAKVRRPIAAGEEVHFEASLIKAFGAAVAIGGVASIAGEICAESEMYFRLPSDRRIS